MDGLGKLMSLATSVREKMLENIKTSRVLAEEDREPSECILEKNLEEENRDDDIVKNLRRTLDSYREKMREDNDVIREFLVSIVDRLDSMDLTAKESPTLTKYMYSEGSREAIIDALPMRLKRMYKEQADLWPMEDGIYEDGTRVLGSDNAEFKKHREILRKMVEYFSPENYTSNSGVPTSSLTVLMRGSRLHRIAVQRAICLVPAILQKRA